MKLNIEDIAVAARRAWDVIVPPLIELAIVLGAFTFLFGWSEVAALFLSLKPSLLLPSEDVQAVLKFYGITALAPVSFAIFIVFVANGVGLVIRWLGRWVPGYLIWNSTKGFFLACHKYLMLQFWVLFPDCPASVNGLNFLSGKVNEAVDKAGNDPEAFPRLRGAYHLGESVEAQRSRIRFAKGLAVVSIGVWAFSPFFPSLPRPHTLSLALLISFIFMAISGLAILRIEFQSIFVRQAIHAYLEYEELKRGATIESGLPENWGKDSENFESLTSEMLKDPVWSFRLFQPFEYKSSAVQLARALQYFIQRKDR